MRILLTGGSGFIGKNIQEQLNGRHEILAPRHRQLELTDYQAVKRWFKENRPEAVIHSATKPGHRNAKDPEGVFKANLQMFTHVLEAAQSNQVKRFLFLGSGSEFDMNNYRPKMAEETLADFVPVDDTGFSKYLCNQMLKGIPGYLNVRFFGIFGRYEDYAIRFISNAICKVLFDLPITLRQDRLFDYTYIDDGVNAIERFLLCPEGDLRYNDYNVTPPKAVGLLEIAQLICLVAGKPDHPIKVQMSGRGHEYSGDNQRFTQLFSDFAFTPLEESVRMLYDWYASIKAEIDINLLLSDK